MTASSPCADASLDAEESLAATATTARAWLLVEVRGAWGRDAVPDTELPPEVRATLTAFEGKVIFLRRPDRRSGVTVVHAVADEDGGVATRQELADLVAVADLDLTRGDVVAGPFVLVCTHGRRDACCARLGVPLFDALGAGLDPARLWQASHLGGHRFAPNVLVVPFGLQFGRIPPERAAELAHAVAEGRIPLDLYRGRTIYEPPVQAAELLVRSVAGCDRVRDLRLLSHADDRVTFATPSGELTALVEPRPGPAVPASCGAEPEPTVAWVATLVRRAGSVDR